jgi:hypothetical protein
MPHRFLHIGMNFGEVIKTTELEPVVQAVADDWIRYTPTNWIIWTGASNADVAAALRRNLTLNDQFLLFPINPLERDGYHQPWVWEWLNRPRSELGLLSTPLDWSALTDFSNALSNKIVGPKKL